MVKNERPAIAAKNVSSTSPTGGMVIGVGVAVRIGVVGVGADVGKAGVAVGGAGVLVGPGQ